MKTLALVVLVGSLTMASSQVYANEDINATADDIGKTICNSIVADDKKSLRQVLRLVGVRLSDIYEGVRCNNLTLIQFAMKNASNDIGKFMVKQVSKKVLRQVDDAGWAKTNGFESSAIVSELNKRTQDGS